MAENVIQPAGDTPPSRLKTLARALLPYVLAVVVAFAVVGVVLAILGFDVTKAYRTILFTSFRTPNGFVQTLNKWTPLVLIAYSFTIPLAAGKFNIGGEGQLIIGAVGAAGVGIMFAGLPLPLLLPLVLLAGFFLARCGWRCPPGCSIASTSTKS